MSDGFFLLHRGISKHPMFYGRPDWLGAWVMLIEEARYADGGELVRGEMYISESRLQSMFGWSRKKVRYFLDELCSNGMISRAMSGSRRGQRGAKLTICNYCKYQDDAKSRGHVGAKSRHDRGLSKKEEQKEEQKLLALGVPQFADFYKLYPRKKKPDAAKAAWDKATKSTPPQTIIDGLKRQLPSLMAQEEQFRPYPASWLNGGEWKNEVQSKGKKITKEEAARLGPAKIMELHGGR